MRKKLRVLLAEDERVIRLHLKSMIKKLGHLVIADTGDGEEALRLARELAPDLVVADIKMPGLSGLELAERVCRHRATPFVIVTAYHEEDLIDRAAKQSHLASYLVKPIEEKDLMPAIQLALSRCEGYKAMHEEVDSLKQSLEDRKVIEKAKGIVMRASNLSEADAHRKLQRMARKSNKKLAEVARAILLAEEGLRP
ncbi:MAG: response regulator [Elusimicrobiota bacterium]